MLRMGKIQLLVRQASATAVKLWVLSEGCIRNYEIQKIFWMFSSLFLVVSLPWNTAVHVKKCEVPDSWVVLPIQKVWHWIYHVSACSFIFTSFWSRISKLCRTIQFLVLKMWRWVPGHQTNKLTRENIIHSRGRDFKQNDISVRYLDNHLSLLHWWYIKLERWVN